MEAHQSLGAKALIRRQKKMYQRRMEIEKLKTEYEQFRDLNEQIIEAKMRQVRLNRLFREIEELKEESAIKAKVRPTPRKVKTEDEIRYDNIRRARALGQEFSRLNALVKYDDMIDEFKSTQVINKNNQKLYYLEKRLAYGNKVSKSNAECPRADVKKEWNARKVDTSRLHNRLSYGNTHSYINVLLSLKNNRKVLSMLLRNDLGVSNAEELEAILKSQRRLASEAEEDKKEESGDEHSETEHESGKGNSESLKVAFDELLKEIDDLQKTKSGKQSQKTVPLKALLFANEEAKKSAKAKSKKAKAKVKAAADKKLIAKKLKELQKESSSSNDEDDDDDVENDAISTTSRLIQETLFGKKAETAAAPSLHQTTAAQPKKKHKQPLKLKDLDLEAIVKNTEIKTAEDLDMIVPLAGMQRHLKDTTHSANQEVSKSSLTATFDGIKNYFLPEQHEQHDQDDHDDHEDKHLIDVTDATEETEQKAGKRCEEKVSAKSTDLASLLDLGIKDYQDKYIF